MKIKLSLFLLIIALSNATVFSEENPGARKFIMAGWIPYWQKSQGYETIKSKLNFFSALSPFAFEVGDDGSIIDTLKINEPPWTDLLPKAKDNKILILPTILWTDSKAIHKILKNAAARKQHIREIINLIETKNFDGIDIDYEGKDVADKGIFSVFITELSCALKAKGYYLSCTIEARTMDQAPNGWRQTRAMAWANDFSVLNKYCDEVRIMAYDQPFQTKGAKEWQDNSEHPYAANADITWVEEVIKYALQKIAPEKIVLGIPTYGWEFTFKGTPENWSYKRFKSTTYPQAMALAKSYSIIPTRDHSGELSFIYQKEAKRYLDYFPDSESIRQKIQLAKKYNLGGIVFFKLDGLEDKKMWDVLKKEVAARQERLLIVTDQIANIRKEPISEAYGYVHDDSQETQVLYNEILCYKDENKDWYKIEAIEQREFSHSKKWQGYPGWIKKENVELIASIPEYNGIVKNKIAKIYSVPAAGEKVFLTALIGTRFKIIAEQGKYYKVELADHGTGWVKKEDLSDSGAKLNNKKLRENILATAKLFLGMPYLWGGRSVSTSESNTTAAGVDCSGLTSLVYRANNIYIPRDAHEQWMVSDKIPAKDLMAGDLIFVSAKDLFETIVHVMLYTGGENFIESPASGDIVRIRTFKDKFGMTLSELEENNFIANDKKLYFGKVVITEDR